MRALVIQLGRIEAVIFCHDTGYRLVDLGFPVVSVHMLGMNDEFKSARSFRLVSGRQTEPQSAVSLDRFEAWGRG